jgi:hypothetical protein
LARAHQYQDFGQQLAQEHSALPHRDAALDQEAANLIDHTCPLADQGERTRCSDSRSTCSGVLIVTKLMIGRCELPAAILGFCLRFRVQRLLQFL